MIAAKTLILASASKSRATLLRAAGIAVEIIPAHADEDAVKASLKAEDATAAQCAETLAELKAIQVSQRHHNALVIGADQMLECDGVWFDKPANMAGARDHLVNLRGKTHALPTAVAVALNGARIWHHVAIPRLTMRPFTDAFIDSYLALAGAARVLAQSLRHRRYLRKARGKTRGSGRGAARFAGKGLCRGQPYRAAQRSCHEDSRLNIGCGCEY